jgi:transcriptional regulator with XRE-family HTH domain
MDGRIGAKMKRLRETAGLSQQQVADFLEVDQTTISKCENGERRFQTDQLEQLADLFGCAIKNIVSDDIVTPLHIGFRANSIENEDLVAIADIQKIALNLDLMHSLLEGHNIET